VSTKVTPNLTQFDNELLFSQEYWEVEVPGQPDTWNQFPITSATELALANAQQSRGTITVDDTGALSMLPQVLMLVPQTQMYEHAAPGVFGLLDTIKYGDLSTLKL